MLEARFQRIGSGLVVVVFFSSDLGSGVSDTGDRQREQWGESPRAVPTMSSGVPIWASAIREFDLHPID